MDGHRHSSQSVVPMPDSIFIVHTYMQQLRVLLLLYTTSKLMWLGILIVLYGLMWHRVVAAAVVLEVCVTNGATIY